MPPRRRRIIDVRDARCGAWSRDPVANDLAYRTCPSIGSRLGPGWGCRLMADLTYEVSFKGVASPTLRAAFTDCERHGREGVTAGCTKTALLSVIARIAEFGLQLLAVRLIAHHPADDAPRPTDRNHPPRDDDNGSCQDHGQSLTAGRHTLTSR